MDYKTVKLDRENGIAILTLNRPETLNAWNDEMHRDAIAALEEIDKDDDIRVLIITGAGKGFSSGADVSQDFARLRDMPSTETPIGQAILDRPNLVGGVEKLANLSKPVIAAVNGAAVGAGFSLALACDMRVASDRARFSINFVKRALAPDAGGTFLLPRLIGLSQACRLIFTADMLDAEEAKSIGLVDSIIPHENLMSEAKKLAGRIAENPPLTVKLAKKLIYQGLVAPNLSAHLTYEVCANFFLMSTDDFKESTDSFMEKRSPVFKGK
ncbi:enoyl-CoA hydratase/isomerase family protein [Thermodesulfobacteriota bacterium]